MSVMDELVNRKEFNRRHTEMFQLNYHQLQVGCMRLLDGRSISVPSGLCGHIIAEGHAAVDTFLVRIPEALDTIVHQVKS